MDRRTATLIPIYSKKKIVCMEYDKLIKYQILANGTLRILSAFAIGWVKDDAL